MAGVGAYEHCSGRMGAQELAAGGLHLLSAEEEVALTQMRHRVHSAYDVMKSSRPDAEMEGSHL